MPYDCPARRDFGHVAEGGCQIWRLRLGQVSVGC